jgi:hypothetical protein
VGCIGSNQSTKGVPSPWWMIEHHVVHFAAILQSIFTQLHQIQTHSSHTLWKTSHTIILNFHLPPSSMLRSFFVFSSNFVIYKIWNIFYKITAKLVKFALGKKKISQISESFGWNNNNSCLGKKKQLSCQLRKVTILQQPTNFKEVVHQFEVFLLSSQFGIM